MAKMAKISCLLHSLSRFKVTSQNCFFAVFEMYCEVLQDVSFPFLFALSFYRMATVIVIDETIWVVGLTLVRRTLCLYYLSFKLKSTIEGESRKRTFGDWAQKVHVI